MDLLLNDLITEIERCKKLTKKYETGSSDEQMLSLTIEQDIEQGEKASESQIHPDMTSALTMLRRHLSS